MTVRALVYAVRPAVVAQYVGELCLPLCLALSACIVLAVLGKSWVVALALLGTALVTGAAGVFALRAPEVADIQTNESMVVVALAFILASLAMVPAFVAYGLSPVDAFFEAVSGVTTTGLSVVDGGELLPWDFRLMRNLLQWFGGLGFVTLSVLLISHQGSVVKRLRAEEGAVGDLAAHTRSKGLRALILYVGVTAVGIVCLLVSGLGIADAVGLGMSAVSTGGFAGPVGSVDTAGFGSKVVLALLFTIGALPFMLIDQVFRRQWRPVLRDPQLLGLLGLGGLAGLLLFVLQDPTDGSFWTRAGEAIFLAFSAQTTTGYALGDPAGLNAAAKSVLLAVMFVGGCAGSTAGGIKIWRALVIFRLGRDAVLETSLPDHAVYEPQIAGERLEDADRTGIPLLVLLFLAVIGLSWLAFLVAGHPPLNALFDVVSATSTVGLGTGVVNGDLTPALKGVVCLDMLMGRLEILAILVLLVPRTWFARRRSVR